jgi:hypothetical protein
MAPGVPAYDFGWADLLWIAALGLSFGLTHRASFKRNLESDRRAAPDFDTLLTFPYARVVPMHAMIVIGLTLGYSGAILLFGALKTLADAAMHAIEHRAVAVNVKSVL